MITSYAMSSHLLATDRVLDEWNLDSIRQGQILMEKAQPGTALWEAFQCIPKPSAEDFADASQGNGVLFRTLSPLARPSAKATVLNDGKAQSTHNRPAESVFFENGIKQGRLLIDLKGEQPVYAINTYSWHVNVRQSQAYKLFYNNRLNPSDPKAVPLGKDWISLGTARTSFEAKTEGQVAVSFSEAGGGILAEARQLLFVITSPYCFFGEVDVHTKPIELGAVSEAKTDQLRVKRMAAVLDGSRMDRMHGNLELVDGVKGQAMKFDGFTSRVVRPAAQVAPLAKAFTIEAWVAPQEFSQNQTAIINQSVDRKTGYFLGIEQHGKLIFQANIGGKWQVFKSAKPLPLFRWSHVLVTFDPEGGVSLYINGNADGHHATQGELIPAPEVDLWIGMSHMQQAPDVHTRTGEPNYQVWDGLIDALKIHEGAFAVAEVKAAYAAAQPVVLQPLQYRKMPAGPQDGKRFGAFYTRLNYAPEWEATWRVGDFSDVVVTFEDSRANFVFWRGTGYIPHWVSDNGIWYNNQFVERRANADGCSGCIEPMSDKRCRYSHVRIIQSNPARTILHWRYALVGLNYKHVYLDPYTGQGDWVDEYYTIYPDMVGVRSMTLYSSQLEELVDWQESIIVHQSGRLPEDNIEAKALTVGNLSGEIAEYTWPGVAVKGGSFEGLPKLPCIQVINLKSELRPFMIIPPAEKVQVGKFRGHAPNSIFRTWNHWPVSQGRTTSTNAVDASRPAHSTVSFWKHWEPHRSTENSKTLLHLHGMTDKGAAELTGLAKAWITPPELKLFSRSYRYNGFDREQKAYCLDRLENSGTLHLELMAESHAPLVNPVLVVKNWPADKGARVKVNGRTLKSSAFRFGRESALEGDAIVIWLPIESNKPIEIKVQPVSL